MVVAEIVLQRVLCLNRGIAVIEVALNWNVERCGHMVILGFFPASREGSCTVFR